MILVPDFPMTYMLEKSIKSTFPSLSELALVYRGAFSSFLSSWVVSPSRDRKPERLKMGSFGWLQDAAILTSSGSVSASLMELVLTFPHALVVMRQIAATMQVANLVRLCRLRVSLMVIGAVSILSTSRR